MQALLKLFISISILKKGPQDIPYSRFLFFSLLIVLFVFDTLFHQLAYSSNKTEISTAQSVSFVAISYAVIYTVIYLLIRAHGFGNRVVQTLTALLGVDLVVRSVQLPLILLAILFAKQQGLVLMLSFMYFMTIGWSLVIYMHVFKNALSTSALRATLITIALFSLILFLDFRLNPAGGS